MKVTVTYFAVLREQSGITSESVDTAVSSLGELYEELRARHRFTLPQTLVRPAVGNVFRAMADPISEGDAIVYVPPVAGG